MIFDGIIVEAAVFLFIEMYSPDSPWVFGLPGLAFCINSMSLSDAEY